MTDFFPGEIDALKKYLAKGGTLFAMVDPAEKSGEGALPNLTGLLKEWGIEVGDDVVVDASGLGQMFGAGPTGARCVARSQERATAPGREGSRCPQVRGARWRR